VAGKTVVIGIGVLFAIMGIAFAGIIISYNGTLQEKDRQISLLNTQISGLQNQVENLQNQVQSLQDEINNLKYTQVQVSGTISIIQAGTIYFNSFDGKIQTSSPFTDGRYSVSLVGGQSYNVDIRWTYPGGVTGENFTLYVPEGATTFTADF
jgi:prophage DNA circulation protein